MLQTRPIQENDLPQLVSLFNNEYQYDQIDEEILYEKIFLEPSFSTELNIKVIEDGRIIGFSSGLVREVQNKKIGWIKLFVIEDFGSLSRKIVDFFKYMENRLIENHAQVIRIFDSFPNYLTPGVDPRYTHIITLLDGHGYHKRRDNVNMTVNLETQDFTTQDKEKKLLEEHGIQIKRIEKEELEMLFQFIEKNFPLWIYEVRNSSRLDPIAIHIAKKDRSIIAFSAYNGNNKKFGWFGPMGTDISFRGKGIGSLLLKRCLRDMKDQGYKTAIIPWVGPIGFYYREVRARVSRVFWNYEKIIEGK